MTRYGPWASIKPARAAGRDQARRDAPTPGGTGNDGRRGFDGGELRPWRLDTNERGDLVARHDNGTATVLASNPEVEE